MVGSASVALLWLGLEEVVIAGLEAAVWGVEAVLIGTISVSVFPRPGMPMIV